MQILAYVTQRLTDGSNENNMKMMLPWRLMVAQHLTETFHIP